MTPAEEHAAADAAYAAARDWPAPEPVREEPDEDAQPTTSP
jgi:hypothetical protein